MDTNETYIKMMVAAWPDLKDKMPIGMMLFSRRQRMLCFLDGKVVRWSEKVNTSNVVRATPLLEQDQLQEMLEFKVGTFKDNFWSALGDLHDYAFNKVGEFRMFIPTSMEQLWLAFLMKQNHNKTWDGEGWQKLVS